MRHQRPEAGHRLSPEKMARRINDFVSRSWGGRADGGNLVSKNSIRTFVGDSEDQNYVPKTETDAEKLQAIVGFLLKHAPTLVTADDIYDDRLPYRPLAALTEFYWQDIDTPANESPVIQEGKYAFEFASGEAKVISERPLTVKFDPAGPGYVVEGSYIQVSNCADTLPEIHNGPFPLRGFILSTQQGSTFVLRDTLHQMPVFLMKKAGPKQENKDGLLFPGISTDAIQLEACFSQGSIAFLNEVASGVAK